MQASRILEIGTAYGYATLWMAFAQPRLGKIWTIEPDAHRTDVALSYFKQAGEDDYIEIFNTPRARTARKLSASQPRHRLHRRRQARIPRVSRSRDPDAETFRARRRRRLPFGRPPRADRGDDDADVAAMRDFNAIFSRTPRLDATILPLGGGTGHRSPPAMTSPNEFQARDAPRPDRRNDRHESEGRRTARAHAEFLCERFARPARPADLRQSRSAQLPLHFEFAHLLRERPGRRAAPARRALRRKGARPAVRRGRLRAPTQPARRYWPARSRTSTARLRANITSARTRSSSATSSRAARAADRRWDTSTAATTTSAFASTRE